MIFLVSFLLLIPLFLSLRVDILWSVAYILLLYFFLPLLSYFVMPSIAFRIYFPINLVCLTFFATMIFNKLSIRKFDLLLIVYILLFFLIVGFGSLNTGQNAITDMYFFRNHFFNLLLFGIIAQMAPKKVAVLAKLFLLLISFRRSVRFWHSLRAKGYLIFLSLNT